MLAVACISAQFLKKVGHMNASKNLQKNLAKNKKAPLQRASMLGHAPAAISNHKKNSASRTRDHEVLPRQLFKGQKFSNRFKKMKESDCGI